jgi:hypothetical protein
MKPEIPHRCWIDGTDWIWTDRALYDSCIDPRTASSERFLAKRDDLIMETLALEIGIPFFLVLAGGYQEPMEQKLVSLHLQTFRTAAKINPRLRKK